MYTCQTLMQRRQMSQSRLLFSIFIIITESFQVCENSGLNVDASESTCYFYKLFLQFFSTCSNPELHN